MSVSRKRDFDYGHIANKPKEGKLYILVYTTKCNISLKRKMKYRKKTLKQILSGYSVIFNFIQRALFMFTLGIYLHKIGYKIH